MKRTRIAGLVAASTLTTGLALSVGAPSIATPTDEITDMPTQTDSDTSSESDADEATEVADPDVEPETQAVTDEPVAVVQSRMAPQALAPAGPEVAALETEDPVEEEEEAPDPGWTGVRAPATAWLLGSFPVAVAGSVDNVVTVISSAGAVMGSHLLDEVDPSGYHHGRIDVSALMLPGEYTLVTTGTDGLPMTTTIQVVLIAPAGLISAAPNSVPAGTLTEVSLANLMPELGVTVELTTLSGTVISAVEGVADENGQAVVSLPTPAGTAPGPYRILATHHGQASTTWLTVTAAPTNPGDDDDDDDDDEDDGGNGGNDGSAPNPTPEPEVPPLTIAPAGVDDMLSDLLPFHSGFNLYSDNLPAPLPEPNEGLVDDDKSIVSDPQKTKDIEYADEAASDEAKDRSALTAMLLAAAAGSLAALGAMWWFLIGRRKNAESDEAEGPTTTGTDIFG